METITDTTATTVGATTTVGITQAGGRLSKTLAVVTAIIEHDRQQIAFEESNTVRVAK